MPGNRIMSAHHPTQAGRPTWLRLALIALLLGAFALRLALLTQQNIWWDEARNIAVGLRRMGEIATAPELDIQPPFYYYLLHLWLRLTGMTMATAPATIAWFARALSVAAGVAGVALVAALGQRLAGARTALFATVAAAFSPFWLAESQETRMYTLAIALLSAGAWALLAAQDEARTRRRRGLLAAFALCSAAALLTHYNAVFVLVAWYAWWGVVVLSRAPRRQGLAELLLTGLLTALLFAPIIPVALRQIPTYANPNLTVPSVGAYLAQNVRGHLGGYAFDPAAWRGYAAWWPWAILAVAAVGLLMLAARRLRRSNAERRRFATELGFMLVWLLGGLSLYYIAVLDRGAFNIRYSALVTPALLVLVGAGIAGWGRRLSVAAAALLLAGLLPLAQADLYDTRFAREDIAGATAWLRTNAQPSDLILVDQKYPFGFYYKRYAAEPGDTPQGPEAAPARYLFVDINTVDARLGEWAADARRIYWVQWFESDTDPRHAVPYLLGQSGEPAGEQLFQGWRINWWEMAPPNHFALAPDLAPLNVQFAQAVQTVEASVPAQVEAGQSIDVALRWQRVANGSVDRPLKARVALYDAHDNRLAQADERLLNDRHVAPAAWSADDRPLNVYQLATSSDSPPLAPGDYALRLLVYDAESLEPLEIIDAAGNPAGIEAAIGTISISSATTPQP